MRPLNYKKLVHVAIADIVFCNTILLWLNVIKKMKITAICTMFDAVYLMKNVKFCGVNLYR